MKSFKKIVALIVSMAMLFSLAACSKKDKSKGEVIEAANKYAETLLKQDAKKITKLADDSESDDEDEDEEDEEDDEDEDEEDEEDEDDDSEEMSLEEYLKWQFDYESLYGANKAEAFKAIVDAIEFEVDEDSFEKGKKDTATIDVVFTMPDYEEAAEDATNKDDFIDALGDVDTIDVNVTIEFVKSDDEWLVANTIEVVDEVFAFTEADINFGLTADSIVSTNWWGADDGTYVGGYYIELDVTLADDVGYDYSAYYTVERDGELIYTSSEGMLSMWLTYYASEEGASVLPAGTYTISIYNVGDDEAFYTESCTVEVANPSDTAELEWYYTDGTETNGMPYYEDAFSLGADMSCDVAFDGYFTVEIDGDLVFTSDPFTSSYYYYCSYSEYSCGSVETEPNGCLVAGTYTISVYQTVDGQDDVLVISDSCIVYNSYADGPDVDTPIGDGSEDLSTYFWEEDSEFVTGIDYYGWSDKEGYVIDGLIYDSGEWVEYELVLDSSADSTTSVWYGMLYSATIDGDYTVLDEGYMEPTYGVSAYYYGFNFGTVKTPGYYWVMVYADDTLSTKYVEAICYVK